MKHLKASSIALLIFSLISFCGCDNTLSLEDQALKDQITGEWKMKFGSVNRVITDPAHPLYKCETNSTLQLLYEMDGDINSFFDLYLFEDNTYEFSYKLGADPFYRVRCGVYYYDLDEPMIVPTLSGNEKGTYKLDFDHYSALFGGGRIHKITGIEFKSDSGRKYSINPNFRPSLDTDLTLRFNNLGDELVNIYFEKW